MEKLASKCPPQRGQVDRWPHVRAARVPTYPKCPIRATCNKADITSPIRLVLRNAKHHLSTRRLSSLMAQLVITIASQLYNHHNHTTEQYHLRSHVPRNRSMSRRISKYRAQCRANLTPETSHNHPPSPSRFSMQVVSLFGYCVFTDLSYRASGPSLSVVSNTITVAFQKMAIV